MQHNNYIKYKTNHLKYNQMGGVTLPALPPLPTQLTNNDKLYFDNFINNVVSNKQNIIKMFFAEGISVLPNVINYANFLYGVPGTQNANGEIKRIHNEIYTQDGYHEVVYGNIQTKNFVSVNNRQDIENVIKYINNVVNNFKIYSQYIQLFHIITKKMLVTNTESTIINSIAGNKPNNWNPQDLNTFSDIEYETLTTKIKGAFSQVNKIIADVNQFTFTGQQFGDKEKPIGSVEDWTAIIEMFMGIISKLKNEVEIEKNKFRCPFIEHSKDKCSICGKKTCCKKPCEFNKNKCTYDKKVI